MQLFFFIVAVKLSNAHINRKVQKYVKMTASVKCRSREIALNQERDKEKCESVSVTRSEIECAYAVILSFFNALELLFLKKVMSNTVTITTCVFTL